MLPTLTVHIAHVTWEQLMLPTDSSARAHVTWEQPVTHRELISSPCYLGTAHVTDTSLRATKHEVICVLLPDIDPIFHVLSCLINVHC